VDAGVILGVVVVNAVIGWMLSPQAMVLRDGQRATIPADELVPGDVVFMQSGDKVPADLRLFRVKSLQIQESVLTGESVAVEKRIEPVTDDAELGDRRSMAYSGTLVTYGQGRGVVVATGRRVPGRLAYTYGQGLSQQIAPLGAISSTPRQSSLSRRRPAFG
jgi:magnesium-transporting ATPase (P-type)